MYSVYISVCVSNNNKYTLMFGFLSIDSLINQLIVGICSDKEITFNFLLHIGQDFTLKVVTGSDVVLSCIF